MKKKILYIYIINIQPFRIIVKSERGELALDVIILYMNRVIKDR